MDNCIKIAGHDCPDVETWIGYMGLDTDDANNGPEEAACIRELVPLNYVVINSESDRLGDAEDKIWERLFQFFGRKLYVTSWKKGADHLIPVVVEQDGVSAFACGDMTWCVFIDPELLISLMS